VHVVNSGNKAHISVLACVSASGYAIPPMVIFHHPSPNKAGSSWNHLWVVREWMDGQRALSRVVPPPFPPACTFKPTTTTSA
jgi:hypothetical protein